MMPLISGAARVLATSTIAASVKSAQAVASGSKGADKGATVESKAIDKFIKLNEKLSRNNRKDNKDNLSYIQKMEKSVSNMQKSMDRISKSSRGFVNNIKMLVGIGGVGGMLYTFLKITESYGSPQARFRGKVTSTSLRDQKAFEQMLAVKGINKPDLLDRLGMAATEGGVVGTTANKFFSRMGIDHNKFLSENSAGRLSMVLDKWETIKNIPSISKFFEEFLGSSWAEIKAMREIGDLKSVYKEKSDALKDVDLYRFSKMHETLENVKQNVMNGLVKVFDKLSPTIEKVSKALGGGLVKVINWLASKFQSWDADKWGDSIISLFEKIEKIINFLSNPLDTLKNLFSSGKEDDNSGDKSKEENKNLSQAEKERKSLEKIHKVIDKYTEIYRVSKETQRKAALNVATMNGILGTAESKYINFFNWEDMDERVSEFYDMNAREQEYRINKFNEEITKRGEDPLSDEDKNILKNIEQRTLAYDIIKTYNAKITEQQFKDFYDREIKAGHTPTQITIHLMNNDINQQMSTIQSNKK